MKTIQRKTLLYKTGVEYGDYTINHVEGCSHGCRYPCYAMMMSKRFRKVNSYEEWLEPKIVSNAIELLNTEILKFKSKIKYVHLCFSTDPFMYEKIEISELTIKIIKMLNNNGIRCSALTKGILPSKLTELNYQNEFGITLISLNEGFRKKFEPFSAPYKNRINSLYFLHKNNIKTWVSIEPYPTPNIINQNFDSILDSISFVDKIIFGKLNYNPLVKKFAKHVEYFNELSHRVIEFCKINNKKYHIKNGTMV